MSKNPAAHQNCIEQMKELIVQNYNHPSIMFWGVSNEILIGGISEQLVENHKELNALCKEMDPTRLTTMLEDDSPMEFPAGKMSVKTTIGDIYKNPEAWEFFSKMSGGKMGPDMPMWAMMQNFNLETLMGMMGSAPEGTLKALNKQLNAFDLVD